MNEDEIRAYGDRRADLQALVGAGVIRHERELLAEALDLIDDLIRDNNLTCHPHPGDGDCACSTARALRLLAETPRHHGCEPPRDAPRWDQDPVAIANGWLEGRCGVCGLPIEDWEARDRELIARHLRAAASAVNITDWPAYLNRVADGHADGTSWYRP